MATIIKGPRKGEKVKIIDVRGPFAYLGGRDRMRLGAIEVTHAERQVFLQKYENTDTFNIHYDWGFFLQTNRFKRIQWARL